MVDAYERMFGSKPKLTYASPIEKGDHPELDTSELLDMDGIRKYQSMIGALQWVVTIGRYDVMTAVMTMSGFRVAPRHGHLERLKRIYGYLAKMNLVLSDSVLTNPIFQSSKRLPTAGPVHYMLEPRNWFPMMHLNP